MFLRKQLLLLVVSIIVGIVLAVVLSEIVFFAQHRKLYRNASLHVREKELVNVKKDRDLVVGYNGGSLHRFPDRDSALREYVELINFKKKDSIYRIVCIGGSTTQCVGLENKWKFPYLLEQKLQEKFPGKFEVFNLGLHGAVTKDFIKRFSRASDDANFGWKDLDPDLVILCPVWNDFIIAIEAEFENSIWKKSKEFVREHLSTRFALGYYIYLGLELIYERMQSKFLERSEDYFDRRIGLEKDKFRNRLDKIINDWKKEGTQVYLLLLPGIIEESWSDELIKSLLKKTYGDSKSWFLLHRQFPHIQKADHEIIVPLAEKYNIKYFDFSDHLRGFPILTKINQEYFIDAIHLGPKINDYIAEVLSNSVNKDTEKR